MHGWSHLGGLERHVGDAVDLDVGRGEVRFDCVSFAYDPERPILYDVSFTIPAGQKIAVVGPSGAGKSTLARLLFRFYDVDAGRILINGQDVRAVRQQSLRAAIGIVPQDTVLFNDSLRYNIGYARPGADQAVIEAAARAANIHNFIAGLPKGYDTIVGERGLKLSGGEKRLVSLATVLAMEPEILLLDEPVNGLDIKTKAKLTETLTGLDLSYILVSHDFDFLAETVDAIYTMADGKILLDRELHVHEHVHAHELGTYPHQHQMTADREQRKKDRRRRSEDRRQRSEDRRQQSKRKGLSAED